LDNILANHALDVVHHETDGCPGSFSHRWQANAM
jgi:hypothetical protein